MRKTQHHASFVWCVKKVNQLYYFSKQTQTKDEIQRNSPKRQTCAAPYVEIIELELQTVLCGSGINGNSTESVGIDGFDWI